MVVSAARRRDLIRLSRNVERLCRTLSDSHCDVELIASCRPAEGVPVLHL